MLPAGSRKATETIASFKSRAKWDAWLEKHHQQSTGIWLRLAKKGSPLCSVTYKEALEVALCYGWIDGQRKPENEQTWLQRFLPRSPTSLWSKVNREKVLALIAAGQVQPAGLQAVEHAKRTGRWDTAYDSPSQAAVPDDLTEALAANTKARQFFDTLDRANRYAILWRIQTAKRPETRARRIIQFVAMLERGEKIHS